MVQISPGVAINEIDLTTIVPQVQTSVAAFAGVFRWGPVGKRVLVDSETALVARFGKPTNYNAESFFVCASFLSYSGSLMISRAANTTSTNGVIGVLSAIANSGTVANTLNQLIKNEDDFLTKDGTFTGNVYYVARYPGAMGNSLRVTQCETVDQFNSTINLASYGANGTVFNANAGVNTATLLVTSNSITHANAQAVTLANLFSVGDQVMVGNTSIGKYFQKVTEVAYVPASDSAGNTTTGNATITLHFENEFKAHSDYTSDTTLLRYWEFYDLVDQPPGQSDHQATFGNVSANDELHVVIVDDGGDFTGVPGTVLEVYKALSRATDGKATDGGTNFYKDVINQRSQYVYNVNDRTSAVSNASGNLVSASTTAPLNLTFNLGADGHDESNATVAVLANAYDLFASAEDVDIGLIIAGKAKGGTQGGQLGNYLIDNICEIRKDCVVFISPEKDDCVFNVGDEADDIIAFRNTMRSSSYGFLDSGYKYMYDRYNDLYRWVPLNGDMAGLAARTEQTNDAWWSPAGYNRGQIKNIVKLAWNPRRAFRDQLYKNGINPVVSFPGQGVLLFGDKTMLTKPSAFDRINVRRLFIVLEKAIGEASKYSLFEFNDEFTQALFRNLVNPYLRDVKGRRGVTDFLVVCDDTNNTPYVVDTNQFVGDIYIKPARSINFIQLNFIAVPTGIQFAEVIGKF